METKTRLHFGLNANQLKLIAVLFMTIDHIGAYAFEIPLVGAHYNTLRILGRVAAPLFFFALTDSIRYTRSRPRFLLRLYLAAVGTGLFVSVTNWLFYDSVGFFSHSNIFFTYFYVTLYVILLESTVSALRDRNWRRGLLSMLGIAATILMQPLNFGVQDLFFDLLPETMAFEHRMVLCQLSEAFFMSPQQAEYGILFIFMGVLMYFGKNKYVKTAILLLFSVPFRYFPLQLAHTLREQIPVLFSYVIEPLLFTQSYMFLAAPFMLLYNGEKGRGNKWFFYLYYPTHRYVIAVMEYLYQVFAGA